MRGRTCSIPQLISGVKIEKAPVRQTRKYRRPHLKHFISTGRTFTVFISAAVSYIPLRDVRQKSSCIAALPSSPSSSNIYCSAIYFGNRSPTFLDPVYVISGGYRFYYRRRIYISNIAYAVLHPPQFNAYRYSQFYVPALIGITKHSKVMARYPSDPIGSGRP